MGKKCNPILLFVIVLFILLLPPINEKAYSADDSVRFAILRADGILIPFAHYDNGKWNNTWPEPDTYGPEKLGSIEDIPNSYLGNSKPLQIKWHLIGSEKEVNITKPVIFETHCQTNWGLLTDFIGPKGKYAYAVKRGIAIDNKETGYGANELENDSGEGARILKFITDSFNSLEDKGIKEELKKERIADLLEYHPYINKYLPYSGQPLSYQVRTAFPIKIKDLYMIEIAPRKEKLYYVEATREYPDLGYYKYPCEGISFFKAYIKEDKHGKLSILNKHLELTDCDMKYAIPATPLGIINIGGNYYLIEEKTYYEAEDYNILRIDDKGLNEVLSTFGGGC